MNSETKQKKKTISSRTLAGEIPIETEPSLDWVNQEMTANTS